MGDTVTGEELRPKDCAPGHPVVETQGRGSSRRQLREEDIPRHRAWSAVVTLLMAE